jgi:aspartyl protease family protein
MAMAAMMYIAPPAIATNVTVVGLFPGKAVVVINDGSPRTLSPGQKTGEGVVLLSTDSTSATLEIDGKRQILEMGQHFAAPTSGGAGKSVNLAADERGHFVTMGMINGGTVRFLVDTGATMVALPAAEARRLGISYKQGRLGYSKTANGTVPVYQIKLDTVQVGDVVINQVDATVMEGGLDIALLGMTFLNRTEMKREGTVMTLTKRF